MKLLHRNVLKKSRAVSREKLFQRFEDELMGAIVTIHNDSNFVIKVEVFCGVKNPMHHAPTRELILQPNDSEKVDLSPQINVSIRYILPTQGLSQLHYYHYVVKLINKEFHISDQFDMSNGVIEKCFRCCCRETETENQEVGDELQKLVDKSVIGGAGLVSAIAGGAVAPTVVVGGIQAIGFTSAGIAAGSTAAGMMSSAAIASGGAIASGSTVATLQTIGAVGALAGGPLAAAIIGGSVLGVGATYGVIKIHESLKNPNNECWDVCCEKAQKEQ